MHPSANNYAKLFFDTYAENLPTESTVVDIGAQNVNGSIKDVCPKHYKYIGVDFVDGDGVDIVLDDPYHLPFESDTIDAIVCSSCFEHSEMFWLVFNEMLRVLKPTGLLYLNAPSNGYIHRWPVDCWRFYPDAGHALVNWAKRSGYTPILLESFIGHKESDKVEGVWNDFVAVFAKSELLKSDFTKRIINILSDFDNARVSGVNDLINYQINPQDFRVIGQLNADKSYLDEQYKECDIQLASARSELNFLSVQLSKSNSDLVELQQQLNLMQSNMKKCIDDHALTLNKIYQSTSWKLTKPLRLISYGVQFCLKKIANIMKKNILKLLKSIYWILPFKFRKPLLYWGYQNFPFIFNQTPHYQSWRNSNSSGLELLNSRLVDLEQIQPIDFISGRIAIHLHIYYHDLASEFAEYLDNMPFNYDLFISVKDLEGEKACLFSFSKLKRCGKLKINIVVNRGRDIAPMFCSFGDDLKEYDYIAHLHSKKSLYNAGATEGWRQYLCKYLLGSPISIKKILALLTSGHGIVYPQNFSSLPYMANTWLSNKSIGQEWCARLGISSIPHGYFDFPAGSMFWARVDALSPLFNAEITLDEFAEESGQTDGTLAHCLERLLGLCVTKQGFPIGILRDVESPSWSPWRFEQSINRPIQSLIDQFSNPEIKCIAFDIFDTLVIRPLVNADSTKRLVAAQLPSRLAELFETYRALAESTARNEKGRDVDLVDIYDVFQKLTSLSDNDIATIRSLEEEIEIKSLSPRVVGVKLFEQAKATGKPVILISDMFLTEDVIHHVLNINGVVGWSNLYLSNKVGLRKDSGLLYEHVLQLQKLKPSELLMIGDNEHSDFQIPCDKNIAAIHVLRPTELARGLPKFHQIVDRFSNSYDPNIELTLGQLFIRNFSDISYPNSKPEFLFDLTAKNIGYSIIGPLLTSFTQWLIEKAAEDGVKRLYFLAREGQLMKSVYDLWSKNIVDAPDARYLVVSRRACSVPLIETLEDIVNIAKVDYYQNSISNFLFERFGLELDDDVWFQLRRDFGFSKSTLCEVKEGDLDSLLPLLKKLSEVIFKQARQEQFHLTNYLNSMGLNDSFKSAVVDIGYSGSIQNYLCQLTNQKINGYYLATHQKSLLVSQNQNVTVRGCLVENAPVGVSAPIFLSHGFELEKLLSSNDSQVIRYSTSNNNSSVAIYKDLSQKEKDSNFFRDELRKGVTRFVKDALQIKNNLLPTFSPSLEVCKLITSEFLSLHISNDIKILSNIALDDHYCGRGVV